jgi:hypothetical protein
MPKCTEIPESESHTYRVEKAVIGLNLCPWAKAAVDEGLLHIYASSAQTVDQLLEDVQATIPLLSATFRLVAIFARTAQ